MYYLWIVQQKNQWETMFIVNSTENGILDKNVQIGRM